MRQVTSLGLGEKREKQGPIVYSFSSYWGFSVNKTTCHLPQALGDFSLLKETSIVNMGLNYVGLDVDFLTNAVHDSKYFPYDFNILFSSLLY